MNDLVKTAGALVSPKDFIHEENDIFWDEFYYFATKKMIPLSFALLDCLKLIWVLVLAQCNML